MNGLARAVYLLFGTLATALGVLVLLKPALAVPADGYSPLTSHLIREEGAEGVFIGLMAIWCLFHFEERRPVHYALLVFAALFAAIHWAEYVQGRRGLASPLLNTIPFAALLVTTPFTPSREATSDLKGTENRRRRRKEPE